MTTTISSDIRLHNELRTLNDLPRIGGCNCINRRVSQGAAVRTLRRRLVLSDGPSPPRRPRVPTIWRGPYPRPAQRANFSGEALQLPPVVLPDGAVTTYQLVDGGNASGRHAVQIKLIGARGFGAGKGQLASANVWGIGIDFTTVQAWAIECGTRSEGKTPDRAHSIYSVSITQKSFLWRSANYRCWSWDRERESERGGGGRCSPQLTARRS